MAEEINVRVKHKGMTSAEWKLSPVILLERELGVATDTGEVRVGNGKDKWASLPVIKGEKGDEGDKGDSITVTSTSIDKKGNTVVEFSDGEKITIAKGAKGDKGDSITVESESKDSQGNTLVKFSDGSTITVSRGEALKVESTSTDGSGNTVLNFNDGTKATINKGDKGDSITVESHEKDSKGNTLIKFSDGSNITVDKGDSIKVESTSTDNQGNTLIKFSDGSSATIAKGDKGDPLTFDDLTPEQINQIKAQDVDLTNYATKGDLEKVDVSSQLEGYAKKDHTHDDVYAKGVGVDSEGKINFSRSGKWYFYNSTSSMGNAVALKDHTHTITDVNGLQDELKNKASSTHTHEIADINGLKGALDGKASSTHTHDEYIKKGDPIELTASQKAELKGADGKDGLTTFIRYANNPSGDNMTASPKSDTTHIGIFSSEGRVAPPTSSVYQWTKIKGEPGKQGNPGTPGRDGTSITTWVGTQSQYDSIWSKSSTTLYLIKE